MLSVLAPAKINLSLEVLGRRPDGFHELVSVMQTISLYDRLDISVADGMRFRCSDPRLAGPENLCVRAAGLLQRRNSMGMGCDIFLEKRIPFGAGLGGGSSDAATVLVALREMWNLGIGCKELVACADDLGSDVPFFLYGGRCLVEGRGEIVRPLLPTSLRWYLLTKPDVSVSTAAVFGALTEADFSDGRVTREMAVSISSASASKSGVNGLTRTLFRLYPAAERCYNAVAAVADGPAYVTGSGPTVVAEFQREDQAQVARGVLSRAGYWTYVATHTINTGWTPPCA